MEDRKLVELKERFWAVQDQPRPGPEMIMPARNHQPAVVRFAVLFDSVQGQIQLIGSLKRICALLMD
jgi:hypothetical protein